MDRGTYLEHDGRPAVRFERTYPHPVERVWNAITTTDGLAAWFPSTVTMEPHAGGRIWFGGDPNLDDSTGTVLAYDPPRHLAYSWGEDSLHFELAPDGTGCRLVLINVLAAKDTAARNGAGWHVCLSELTKSLDEIPSQGPNSPDAEPWRPLYEQYVADGIPAGAEIPSGY